MRKKILQIINHEQRLNNKGKKRGNSSHCLFLHSSVLFASNCLVTKSRKLGHDFILGGGGRKSLNENLPWQLFIEHLKYMLCLIMK